MRSYSSTLDDACAARRWSARHNDNNQKKNNKSSSNNNSKTHAIPHSESLRAWSPQHASAHTRPRTPARLPYTAIALYGRYISNGIYSVCIMGALRVFKREQFLFLRSAGKNTLPN